MSSKVASHDEEYDIYSDLPNFQVNESMTKLETKNKYLLKEKQKLCDIIEELQKMLDTCRKQKADLESKNKSLSMNMSSLYKTAACELKRKDRMIEELRREHDNVVFRRHSFKDDHDQQHKDYGHSHKRHSDRIRVGRKYTTTGEAEEQTAQETKIHTSSKNNIETGRANEYNKVDMDIGNVATKKPVPPYTGPLTEYSKRMFAKLHGISVDEINCEVQKPVNCIKDQQAKEITCDGDGNQPSKSNRFNENCTDKPFKSETEASATNINKSVTAPASKTPPSSKKLVNRSLLRSRHPLTDLIKLGTQSIVKSADTKNVQEHTSIVTSNKLRTETNKEALNNKVKEVTHDTLSKADGHTSEKSRLLKFDRRQAHEPFVGSEHSKQDQNRIKQLFHESNKFLTKTKTNRSNKTIITPTSIHCGSISTVAQGVISTCDEEKLKTLNSKLSSVAAKPNIINSNRKSRQAQLMASLFNSPESKQFKNDGSNLNNTSKVIKTTLRPNISSTVKSNNLGKTPPKEQLDGKLADTTPKRQSNSSEDGEPKIPGDIISPILAKISENICKRPVLKRKIPIQDDSVQMRRTQCPKLPAEKLIQNVTENSCSIMGEDTLGMVTSLARTRQTVSPIKTPDKEGTIINNSATISQEHKKKKAVLNFSEINKCSLLQKESEMKSSLMINQHNAMLKKRDVSVCLFSEHGEFKRKRSLRTAVTSETSDDSPEKRGRLEEDNNLNKQDSGGSKIRKMCFTEVNEKTNVSKEKSTIQGTDRNQDSEKIIDLKLANPKNNDSKVGVENNSGKENHEESETLRKHDGRSLSHKERDSYSRRRLSRRFRYSPYRHRRRSPLRSFERNMHRKNPGFFRNLDRRRSQRSKSVTPLRFRLQRSRSPVWLRSRRSVSLSPCRQLMKEKYHKQPKVSYSTKKQEKIQRRLSDDSFLDEYEGKKEVEDSDCRDKTNQKLIAEVQKYENSIKQSKVENSKVIDRCSTHQSTNIDEVSITTKDGVNTKSPLSKEIETNVVSVSGKFIDSPIQKSGSVSSNVSNQTEKECRKGKNNVTPITPVSTVADTPSPVMILKRRSRKVVKLEDNETTSTVSIKSPKKSNDVKLCSIRNELVGTEGNNVVCVIQEQKETTCTVNTNKVVVNHKSVYEDKTVKNKVTENILSNNVKVTKTFCTTLEQKETTGIVATENVNVGHKNVCNIKLTKRKENLVVTETDKSEKTCCGIDKKNGTTSTLITENVNVICDNKTMKNKILENSEKSVHNRTNDVSCEDKNNDNVLTRENVEKINHQYNASGKEALQTPLKKENLYMTLFGTPNSKCSSENTESEEGEISNSSDEGV